MSKKKVISDRVKAIDELDTLCTYVIKYINESQVKSSVSKSSWTEAFTNLNKTVELEKKVDIIDLAQRGSRPHRKALVDIIQAYLSNHLKLQEDDIDFMLSNYYINYYGNISDITTLATTPLFADQINKILISKDADLIVKYEKLAQVCFQEIYGLGPLDEFFNFGMDARKNKIEELAPAGGNQSSITISGQKLKLNKLDYPQDKVDKICKRLTKCSSQTLNKTNPVVETEFIDQSRLTIYGPPFAQNCGANIRRHYANALTAQDRIKLGSTSLGFEKFQDDLAVFYPRILVVGGQSVGKTTVIRDNLARYDANTVVACIESAFELGLENIEHLIVKNMRFGSLPEEQFISKLFRFDADVITIGESRSPVAVNIFTQAAERTEKGTSSTWHASSPEAGIREMAKAFLRGGYATSEREALIEIESCVDLVIFCSNCDSSYGSHHGMRHISRVCEIPKDGKPIDVKTQFRDLFRFDYTDFKLKQVNNISDTLQEILGRRKASRPDVLDRLSNGNYDS